MKDKLSLEKKRAKELDQQLIKYKSEQSQKLNKELRTREDEILTLKSDHAKELSMLKQSHQNDITQLNS